MDSLDVAVQSKAPAAVGRNRPCPCGSGRKFTSCCERSAIAATVGEIRIGDVFIGSILPPPNREVTADRLLPAARVVAEIEALRARGVRVIALELDTCGGGDVGESLAIYRALRTFSDTGGTTIAHVRCVAASTAVALAVGCDVLVMEPGSRLDVHSMAAGDQPHHDGNRAMVEILAARTPTPRATLESWTSLHYLWSPPGRHFVMLSAAETVQIGWGDFVGDSAMVKRLTSDLVHGGSRPRTARSVRLSGLALAAAATLACGEAVDGYRPNAKDPINAITGVTGGQLAYGAVDNPQLAPAAVTPDKVAPKTWTTITPGTGWDAYTGIGQYAIDVAGHVIMRGSIRYVSGTGLPFTFAAGFRPSSLRGFVVASDGAITKMFVDSDGTVSISPHSANATYYFDGVTFPAEQ